MSEFTHLDEAGAARMVDVSAKDETDRQAEAAGVVHMSPSTRAAIEGGGVPKGDVLAVARVAGIQAAKSTSQLIPLCHPLALTGVEVSFSWLSEGELEVRARVHTVGRTGAEMEALCAVAVAGLTVYDMCKALDRAMSMGELRLEHKSGGRSGTWSRE